MFLLLLLQIARWVLQQIIIWNHGQHTQKCTDTKWENKIISTETNTDSKILEYCFSQEEKSDTISPNGIDVMNVKCKLVG